MSKKYKDFASFSKDFNKGIKKINSELAKELPDIGDDMIDLIRNRTKAGYGVGTNSGSKAKNKSLSEGYKKYRSRYNKLDSSTSAKKSNLTLTGSMLASLKAKISKLKMTVTVKPSSRDIKGISNEAKARWLEDMGRPFLYMSKIEINRMTKSVQKRLDDIIDKLF